MLVNQGGSFTCIQKGGRDREIIANAMPLVTDDRLRIVCYKEIIYFYELSKLLHKDKADMMIN